MHVLPGQPKQIKTFTTEELLLITGQQAQKYPGKTHVPVVEDELHRVQPMVDPEMFIRNADDLLITDQRHNFDLHVTKLFQTEVRLPAQNVLAQNKIHQAEEALHHREQLPARSSHEKAQHHLPDSGTVNQKVKDLTQKEILPAGRCATRISKAVSLFLQIRLQIHIGLILHEVIVPIEDQFVVDMFQVHDRADPGKVI